MKECFCIIPLLPYPFVSAQIKGISTTISRQNAFNSTDLGNTNIYENQIHDFRQQNVHIKLPKVSPFEKILSACSDNKIYNLVKVDCFIINIQTAHKKLYVEVLKTVNKKQQFYSNSGFDLKISAPITVDKWYCFFLREFYKNYQDFNSKKILRHF